MDLSGLERERTHTLTTPLEDGAGHLTLLLTISATQGADVTSDLANYTPSAQYRDDVLNRYVSNYTP